MIYRFRDFYNEEIYDRSHVIFLCGQYDFFLNIVSDRFKEMCRPQTELTRESLDLLAEFGSFSGDVSSGTSVDFRTFLEVVHAPNMLGRWFCCISLSELDKKSTERLNEYMEHPSPHGVLVVRSTSYKEYARYLRNRAIRDRVNTNLIQLSFPTRAVLRQVITEMFKVRGLTVDSRATDLFILRLGTEYNSYPEHIDRISTELGGVAHTGEKEEGATTIHVDYDTMHLQLKHVENYVLDDFLIALTKPIKTKKISKNRKIYRMYESLFRNYGARTLVAKLRYKIDDMIEMRLAINSGFVPIKVRYSVKESKSRIGESSKLNSLSDFSFAKIACIAGGTSLKDWMFMRLILESAGRRSSETDCERVLHTLINRATFCENRLLNDIGIVNILDESLYCINSQPWRDILWAKECEGVSIMQSHETQIKEQGDH